MFGSLFSYIRKSLRIREGVSELVREVPGISIPEQEILLLAIRRGEISNIFPSENELIKILLELNDSELNAELNYTSDRNTWRPPGLVELQSLYIKYVLLPEVEDELEHSSEDANKIGSWQDIDSAEKADALFDAYIEARREGKSHDEAGDIAIKDRRLAVGSDSIIEVCVRIVNIFLLNNPKYNEKVQQDRIEIARVIAEGIIDGGEWLDILGSIYN